MYMVTYLHPTRPRYPIHCVIYTFSFTQLLHASHLFLAQTTKPRELFLKASHPSEQPQKGSWPGFGPKRLFPNEGRRHFQLQDSKHQRPKIWLQKAPGQDLAQNGCFPMILDGTFNCRPASHQSPKIWLQKAPGQDLAQNGCFPMIPEGTFHCRLASHQSPKIWVVTLTP